MSPANLPKRIALVDCNNFYASCERVFKPAWNDRPVGVLSNNDGCIIARSDELKEAGIPMGAPYFQYKEQLKKLQAVVVSSNYTLYGDMSNRVMSVLDQFTPHLEIYSIDEAWLDLTGFKAETLDAYARDIVYKTAKYTGIPVSMGIAPTKVLAKLANRICKKKNIPGRVFNLGSAENTDGILSTIEVGDLWGIGKRWSKKLNTHGIYTALDLKEANDTEIRKRYNVLMQKIVHELRGISCIEAEEPEPKKEIMASRSFGKRVTDKQDLVESVSFHATRAAEKLRQQNSVCSVIRVMIRSGRHNPRDIYYANSKVIQFSYPTSDTRHFIKAATLAIDQMYKPNIQYAKAGVSLFEISPKTALQRVLFDEGEPQTNWSEALMKTIDDINSRYGKHTIRFASEGIEKPWAMKKNNVTQAYTTRWTELPVVR